MWCGWSGRCSYQMCGNWHRLLMVLRLTSKQALTPPLAVIYVYLPLVPPVDGRRNMSSCLPLTAFKSPPPVHHLTACHTFSLLLVSLTDDCVSGTKFSSLLAHFSQMSKCFPLVYVIRYHLLMAIVIPLWATLSICWSLSRQQSVFVFLFRLLFLKVQPVISDISEIKKNFIFNLCVKSVLCCKRNNIPKCQ